MHVKAQNLTNKKKDDVLQSMIKKIESIYPFPEVSAKTIIGLQEQISNGLFYRYNSPNEFANEVTNSLEELSNDKHLDLIYNPGLAKALLEDTTPAATTYTDEEAKIEVWNNYGFKELSILDGNIGYINLTVFFATGYAGKKADIAMSYFSECNALIIDLRQNGGGWGDMVDYLLGYFIDNAHPLLLTISESTINGSLYSEVVPQYVPGKKLIDIPIYVLTSPVTASAAEAFTSHLKYFNNNVVIVGKKTKGAENPVTHLAIDENFVLQIPGNKKIYSGNPNTWEGVGIYPDIEVETKDAKKSAHMNAIKKLMSMTTDTIALDKYQWALDGVTASYNNIDEKTVEKISGSFDKIKIYYKGGILYYQYEKRAASKLIPITKNYFLVEGADYFRIKFILSENTVIMKQIFSYGVEREILKDK